MPEVFVDTKVGDGNFDPNQIQNYLLLMEQPHHFPNAFGHTNDLSLEYIFLPGGKGGNAKKAAEDAKVKIFEFIEKTILDKNQRKIIVENLQIKYVGEDGILKTL